MPKDLLNKVAPAIADFVSQRGMRVVVERYDQASFGDVVVEVTSPDFDLRIVRDRGQVALDISASGRGAWHRLENVLAFIGKEPPPGDIPLLVKSLSENVNEVAALMTSDLSKAGFTDFEKQRFASFGKKLFPQ